MAQQTETQDAVRYYPLDVSRLVKGQVLTIPELEHILGVPHLDPRWWRRLLNLRRKIEVLRAKNGLSLLTTRTHRGELVICDDSDASQYNRSMGKRGIRRFARASYRNIHVDATKLTAEEGKAHGRTLLRQAMMLAAIRGARHRALPAPNGEGRRTPKMIQESAATN